MCNVANSRHLVFSGNVAKRAVTIVKEHGSTLMKFDDVFAIKCYTVGAEFC